MKYPKLSFVVIVGGPVLNADSEVFGVATEGRGTHLNILIPIKYIHDMKELNYPKDETLAIHFDR